MRVTLVLIVASLLAAGTYLGLERLGRRAWPAMLARSVAWAALGLLLLNVSCPRPPVERRPLVLLDASLSMSGAGSDWTGARALAESIGEVRFVGDERPLADSTASRGRSRLAPAIAAALALDRPIVVVTDGEIDDGNELAPDVRKQLRVVRRPRTPVPDLALVEVTAPERITAGDTIRVEGLLRAVGPVTEGRDSAVIEVRLADARNTQLARRTLRLSKGEARWTVSVASRGISPGEHLLRVALAGNSDGEPRTDARLLHIDVAETPGVVLVASPADWDARFLFRTVQDVSALPVRGYVQLGREWRSMQDLARVPDEVVRRAVRGADLLILKGRAVERAPEARARGLWLWPSGAGPGAERGDWYLVPTPVSPLGPAFSGLPLDSFPPATQLTPVQPVEGSWVALLAQGGRRGAPRPAMTGMATGRTRQVTTSVDGLWRWSFRGASAEQGYRALVASTVGWLLGTPDSTRGAARPVSPVTANGRPLIFAWQGQGQPASVPVTWTRDSVTRTDSLHFDGAGRATAWLPVGAWRYRLADGAGGLVAVESWSDEFLPRPVVLEEQAGAPVAAPTRTAARDWWWLFALAVAALCAEWFIRKRIGLR